MKLPLNQIDFGDFERSFSSEDSCLQYLAEKKWPDGFICRKCGHTNYCKGKSPYSRRCTRCKKEESATANTIFHRCHIPIPEAFRIVYMVCHNPAISTYALAREIELRQMTCWKLKKRLKECLDNQGEVNVLYYPKGVSK